MLSHNLLLTGDDGGYNLTKSLRFRSSASAYLNRTFGTPTSATTWTISTWIKRGQLGTEQVLFGIFNSGTDYFYFGFDGSTDRLQIFDRPSSGGTNWLTTTQVFRDPSAWYHIVYVFDTTQATSTNRQKLYINGVQVTSFNTQTPGTQNSVARWNASGNVGYIGRSGNSGGQAYIDMYQAELNFIDGQALTPSSFGSTNALTGVWQPAKYTGTYGTNGFYLPFTNTTSTSTLGNDFSGNSNTWTVNNISLTAGATYDSMTDVPTLTSTTVANYAVMNPLNKASLVTVTDGNLTLSPSSASWGAISGTVAVTSSKWYYEYSASISSPLALCGWATTDEDVNTTYGSAVTKQWGMIFNSGNKYGNGANAVAYASAVSANTVVGVALDMDNGTLTFYIGGVSQGTAFSTGLTGKTLVPWISVNSGSGAFSSYVNFGQRPFTYTPPTGFVALNTFNLPTSTIVKGNTVMDATLYTGNGTGQSIVNAAPFKPDFVWIKCRTTAYQHNLYDSVRGVQNVLVSDQTYAENISGTADLTAFNSNGFTIRQTANYELSASGQTYVGWQWQAGQGTTSNITVGQYSTSPNVPSIASTVSVNATAGFSIVTYTGTGANATVGHGLGVAPSMVIIKNRTATATAWNVYQSSIPSSNLLSLNSTVASFANTNRITAVSATTFSIGTDSDVNGSTNSHVAYCWSEIAGFSKFGSYTGNGSTDGTFIYTGFRPKFVMVKCSSNATNWWVYDSSRNTYNEVDLGLLPSLANTETSGYPLDFLSNGFKFRNSNGDFNGSGRTYIYMAFAENPFKNSLAR